MIRRHGVKEFHGLNMEEFEEFHTANWPGPSRKANQGAQQPGGPRPIELWASMLDRSKELGA